MNYACVEDCKLLIMEGSHHTGDGKTKIYSIQCMSEIVSILKWLTLYNIVHIMKQCPSFRQGPRTVHNNKVSLLRFAAQLLQIKWAQIKTVFLT